MKNIIKASKLVADVRLRVSDAELMEKYRLSQDQLQKVFERLVEKRALRKAELEERGTLFDDPRNRNLTRRAPRYYLKVPLRVARVDNPCREGIITDLSESGFRSRYLEARVGEVSSFAILSFVPLEEAQVTVTAACRWTVPECDEQDLDEAGFEILAPSKQTRRELRSMIKRFVWGDRNIMWPKTFHRDK